MIQAGRTFPDALNWAVESSWIVSLFTVVSVASTETSVVVGVSASWYRMTYRPGAVPTSFERASPAIDNVFGPVSTNLNTRPGASGCPPSQVLELLVKVHEPSMEESTGTSVCALHSSSPTFAC